MMPKKDSYRPGRDRILMGVMGTVTLLAAWNFAATRTGSILILPSPTQTFQALLSLPRNPEFIRAISGTLSNVALAFTGSLLAGALFGLAAGLFRPFYNFLYPFMTTIRATPVMALILVSLFWFKSHEVAVFSAFLMAFPVVYTAVVGGVSAIDQSLLEMSNIFKVPSRTRLRHLVLPSIAPHLAAGATNCMGLSWKVVVAGEILAQPNHSLGSMMQDSRLSLETPNVLALAIVVVILCGASEFLLGVLARRLRSREVLS